MAQIPFVKVIAKGEQRPGHLPHQYGRATGVGHRQIWGESARSQRADESAGLHIITGQTIVSAPKVPNHGLSLAAKSEKAASALESGFQSQIIKGNRPESRRAALVGRWSSILGQSVRGGPLNGPPVQIHRRLPRVGTAIVR